MKRLSALLLLLSLFTLTAWTLEDCVEVNFDHPDCDRYVTTTTFTDQTTTTTIGETTTTVPPTTTTIQECAPGLIHVPPFCLEPTTTAPPVPDTTSVITPSVPRLPDTGPPFDVAMAVLAMVSLLFLGFTALKYGRRAG